MRIKKVITLSLVGGFTLIEVLIVVSILVLLMVALLMSVGNQREKAEDARVKSDLDRLKIAFEDYYNDNNCYPPPEWFDSPDDCGSGYLRPYLNQIPCDKKTTEPYSLEYEPSQCSGFRLYAKLAVITDPKVFSTPVTIGSSVYNYAVSSSNLTADPNGASTGEGGSVPYWYCSNGPAGPGQNGNCTTYYSSEHTCSPIYTSPNCDAGDTGAPYCQSASLCD